MQGFEVKMQGDSLLELYIYGEIMPDYKDFWGDTVKSETSATSVREALDSHANVEKINIYINSVGGSAIEGATIYNLLKRHKAKKTAYIDGWACSAASVVAMAADLVVMPKNALMMIHKASMWVYGNADELRLAAADLDLMDKAWDMAYLEKVGGKVSDEEILSLIAKGSWLTAEDCLRLGLADCYGESVQGLPEQKANPKQALGEQLSNSLSEQIKMWQESCVKAKEEKEPEPTLWQSLGAIWQK